jgi:hypothetical protein
MADTVDLTRITEYHEEEAVLDKKVKKLARWVSEAK